MTSKASILLLCLLGLGACRSDPSRTQVTTEKQQVVNEIRRSVALQLKNTTGLRPIGTMGQMLRQVEKLGLSFQCSKPLGIVEGRKLLLQAVNAMLDEVNQNAKIRPYLYAYPFLPMDVEMEIFIRNPDGGDVPDGALCLVVAQDASLEYKIYNSTRRGFITVYKETFDQALERFADPSLPLVAFEPDPEISQEELARLRKGISFVGNDGVIWHLGETGEWIRSGP